MRQIREVLRLRHEVHLGERQIAAICLVGKGTVQRYLRRAAAAGLSWPLPNELDDAQLEKLLFPPAPAPAGSRPQPDFTKMHQELKSNRSVTLQLLWEEYKEGQPEGINYSWFCQQYREWARHLDVVMRQDHRAGEKLFVDHAGDTMQVTNPATGEKRTAYLYVAVLGASNYTYAEATWTRDLSDWIGSHTLGASVFRRCAEDGGAGSVAGGSEPAMLLGTGVESNVSGLGASQWSGNRAGASRACPGQGQSGTGRITGAAMDRGGAAKAAVLQPGAVERCDPGVGGQAESEAVPETAGLADRAVRETGSAGADVLAASSVCVRAMEKDPRGLGLPRGSGRPSLLHAVSAGGPGD